MRGWVELDSQDSLKPAPTARENTEHIALVNSYSQIWTKPIILPGLPCCFNHVVAYCPKDDSSKPTIHPHSFDSNWLKLICLCKSSVFTVLALLSSVYSCASFHSWPFQVSPSNSTVSTRVQSQIKLLPPLNGKTYAIRPWSIFSF